jgi:predicted transcriptional regulator
LLLLNALICISGCLHIIASTKNSETAKTALVKDLVLLSCEYFVDYASCTVHLASAENLVRVLQVLSNFVPTEVVPKRNIGMSNLFIEFIIIHFLTYT